MCVCAYVLTTATLHFTFQTQTGFMSQNRAGKSCQRPPFSPLFPSPQLPPFLPFPSLLPSPPPHPLSLILISPITPFLLLKPSPLPPLSDVSPSLSLSLHSILYIVPLSSPFLPLILPLSWSFWVSIKGKVIGLVSIGEEEGREGKGKREAVRE